MLWITRFEMGKGRARKEMHKKIQIILVKKTPQKLLKKTHVVFEAGFSGKNATQNISVKQALLLNSNPKFVYYYWHPAEKDIWVEHFKRPPI